MTGKESDHRPALTEHVIPDGHLFYELHQGLEPADDIMIRVPDADDGLRIRITGTQPLQVTAASDTLVSGQIDFRSPLIGIYTDPNRQLLPAALSKGVSWLIGSNGRPFLNLDPSAAVTIRFPDYVAIYPDLIVAANPQLDRRTGSLMVLQLPDATETFTVSPWHRPNGHQRIHEVERRTTEEEIAMERGRQLTRIGRAAEGLRAFIHPPKREADRIFDVTPTEITFTCNNATVKRLFPHGGRHGTPADFIHTNPGAPGREHRGYLQLRKPQTDPYEIVRPITVSVKTTAHAAYNRVTLSAEFPELLEALELFPWAWAEAKRKRHNGKH